MTIQMGEATGVTGNEAAVLTEVQAIGRKGSGIIPGPGHRSVDIDMAALEMMDLVGTDLPRLLSRGQSRVENMSGHGLLILYV